MIPKRIFTIWLNDDPVMPDLIHRCSSTHLLEGYEHRLITLTSGEHDAWPKYVHDCINAKHWAKAVDFLRAWYLEREGGIYLDADVEILEGKSFDDLLDQEIFCCEEENGFVSNAIIGSVAHHPVLQDFLGKVERNFRGAGDLVFQPGMFLWTEIVRYTDGVKIYPPDVFLPYNHHLDRLELTENSRTIHHFSRSWTQP